MSKLRTWSTLIFAMPLFLENIVNLYSILRVDLKGSKSVICQKMLLIEELKKQPLFSKLKKYKDSKLFRPFLKFLNP